MPCERFDNLEAVSVRLLEEEKRAQISRNKLAIEAHVTNRLEEQLLSLRELRDKQHAALKDSLADVDALKAALEAAIEDKRNLSGAALDTAKQLLGRGSALEEIVAAETSAQRVRAAAVEEAAEEFALSFSAHLGVALGALEASLTAASEGYAASPALLEQSWRAAAAESSGAVAESFKVAAEKVDALTAGLKAAVASPLEEARRADGEAKVNVGKILKEVATVASSLLAEHRSHAKVTSDATASLEKLATQKKAKRQEILQNWEVRASNLESLVATRTKAIQTALAGLSECVSTGVCELREDMRRQTSTMEGFDEQLQQVLALPLASSFAERGQRAAQDLAAKANEAAQQGIDAAASAATAARHVGEAADEALTQMKRQIGHLDQNIQGLPCFSSVPASVSEAARAIAAAANQTVAAVTSAKKVVAEAAEGKPFERAMAKVVGVATGPPGAAAGRPTSAIAAEVKICARRLEEEAARSLEAPDEPVTSTRDWANFLPESDADFPSSSALREELAAKIGTGLRGTGEGELCRVSSDQETATHSTAAAAVAGGGGGRITSRTSNASATPHGRRPSSHLP
eukprot:GHVT01095720.1.p1 GENE.GHVT01095720.1~~GHVT01095720.1.p1  ORF type:complete len:578 (-),score=183.76 GHVT01095720.1:1384-3117(-)